MRTWPAAATVIVALATLGALTVPALANGSPAERSDQIALLQRRVDNLEHTVKALTRASTLQGRINSAQTQLNGLVNDRLTALEGRTPSVTWSTGAAMVVSPHTWSANLFASCLTGTRIGGGFTTNYPVMIGGSYPSSDLFWNVQAYNPYDNYASVTPYAVCLSLEG